MFVSKSQISSDLKTVASLLGHSPSSVEYAQHGRYHVRTVQRKFNQKWPEIINTIGLRYTRRTSGPIVSTEELKRDLKRVAYQLGHPPTRYEYTERGKFDPETMRRRSGERKWEDAVAAIAGFQVEEIKSSQAKGGCYRSTSEWLKKVHALFVELGHAPTTAEANAAGINAHQLCLRVRGRWVDVLAAAKVDLTKRRRHAQLLSTPTESLIADVVRVSHRLGRPAKAKEYESAGHYSSVVLAARLGGWKQTKKIVGESLFGKRPPTASASELPGLTLQAIGVFFNQERT